MKTEMLSRWMVVFVACGVTFAAILAAAGQAPPAAKGPPHAQSKDPSVSAGEKVFMANCSRCHTPPMALSPRVTGTIVAHMRVRARLSRKDEQLLLNYLAP